VSIPGIAHVQIDVPQDAEWKALIKRAGKEVIDYVLTTGGIVDCG